VTRGQALLALSLLVLVALAHAAARFTQFGGAQFAPSVAMYTLMALLLAPRLRWSSLIGLAAVTGILTTITTSSDPPTPNLIAHSGGFLAAAGLAKIASRGGHSYKITTMLAILAATLVVSWTLFATGMWLLLAGTPFADLTRERFGVSFGQGFFAWWLFGFLSIAIPSYVLGVILLPLLYGVLRPAVVRQCVVPSGDEWIPTRAGDAPGAPVSEAERH
jgi:hypothetical protein